MLSPRTIIASSVALLALASLPACAPLALYAGANVAATVAQERSVGQAFDDFTLQSQLETKLAQESLELFRHVDTEVVNGRVLLTGRVRHADDKLIAGQLAWGLENTRAVANEIEVERKGRVGTYFNDLRISEQLRAKLATDGQVAWVNYNVETVKGKVYLLGVARSQAELEKVTLHARTIPGVQEVVSYVDIQHPAPQQAQTQTVPTADSEWGG